MEKLFLCLALCIAAVSPARAADYLELTDFQLVDGTGTAPRAVKSMLGP